MSEIANRQEEQQEAAARLKLIEVFGETVRQFVEDGQVSCSVPPWGACYWIDDETQRAIAEFERKTGGLVFHVIRTPTDLGQMDSFIYVSKYKGEWPADRRDLSMGIAYVFVHATGGAGFSEHGIIGFKVGPAGGLLRTQ